MDEWDLDPPPQRRIGRPTGRDGDARSAPADPGAAYKAKAAGREPDVGATLPASAVAPTDGAIVREAPGVAEKAVRARRRRSRGVVLLASVMVAILLLAVGAVIGFAIARQQNADMAAELRRTADELGIVEKALSQAEERNWNYYRENLALEARIQGGGSGGVVPTSAPPAEPGGAEVFGDGIYVVGEDIAPGVYDGVVKGDEGYWARLKGTDGQVSSIIANGIARARFVLTIYVSDRAVELRGVELTAR